MRCCTLLLASHVSPDGDGDGEIDVKELDSTIRLYKRRKREGNLGTWHGNLDAQQDPVFPNWLIGRDDFQQVFSRRAERRTHLGFLGRPFAVDRKVNSSYNLLFWLFRCEMNSHGWRGSSLHPATLEELLHVGQNWKARVIASSALHGWQVFAFCRSSHCADVLGRINGY